MRSLMQHSFSRGFRLHKMLVRSRTAACKHYISTAVHFCCHPVLKLNSWTWGCQPVMDSVLRLQQFGLQVSDGHFLLLQRGEVLLRVRRPDSVVVTTWMVAAQTCPSVGQTKRGRKGNEVAGGCLHLGKWLSVIHQADIFKQLQKTNQFKTSAKFSPQNVISQIQSAVRADAPWSLELLSDTGLLTCRQQT